MEGRARSVGNSSIGGMPASWLVQYASGCSSDSPSQPPPLPQSEIGVLDRQFRQARVNPGAQAAIDRAQLADQHPQRPAVAHDVVHRQEQHMGFFPHPQEGNA